MILIRTIDLAEPVLKFADHVRSMSGLPVTMLVDERHEVAGDCRHPKLRLTENSYAALKLYAPADAGWRCGDYGFYLARDTYPDVERFWMIESDVRIVGEADRFFSATESRTEYDFLAARLRPAETDWWWRPHASAVNAQPWRCFFPAVRLSARAIDLLYEKRKKQSKILSRRLMWPNDESFVATTIVGSVLRHADLNSLGNNFYSEDDFSYENIIDEDMLCVDRSGPPKLLHPVLSGLAYQRKKERVSAHGHSDPWAFRIRRAMVRRVNARRDW
jgi:hypothetical protein